MLDSAGTGCSVIPPICTFQAQWNDIKTDTTGGGSVSDDGYEVSGGVRWKILKWLEVKGQANWSDYSDGGNRVVGRSRRAVLAVERQARVRRGLRVRGLRRGQIPDAARLRPMELRKVAT